MNVDTIEKFLNRVKAVQGSDSTRKFASRIGMTQQTVALYLAGKSKPSFDFVVNVSRHFGISADWLLGLSDSRAPGGDVSNAPQLTALEKKVHDLEVENATLQKALSLLGSGTARHPVSRVKTGGAPATKSA